MSILKIQKLFINLFSNESFKTIKKILSVKIIIYLIRLIAGIIIAHSLGPEGKGMLISALVIPDIFASFGHIGLPTSNIYFIGKGRDQQTLLINSLLFIFVTSLIYIPIVVIFFPFYQNIYYEGIHPLIAISSLLIISLSISKHFLLNFHRGMEKYSQYNMASIIQPLVRLMLILIVLVYYKLSVEFAIIASILSIFASDIYSINNISKDIPIKFNKKNKKQFKESLKYGAKEYIGHVFGFLNLKFDVFILVALISKYELGIYSVGLGISQLFLFVPSSIVVVLLPKISKSTSTIAAIQFLKKSIILNSILLLPILILFLVFGKDLISFIYGIEFIDSFTLTRVLLLGIFFSSISLLINKYFSGIGRPEIKTIIRIISLPFKIITLIYFVQDYGIYGAAWSYTISNILILILSLIAYMKVKDKEIGFSY